MTPTATRDTQAQEVSFKSKGETLPATFYDNSSVAVVLCPPHPLYGGSRKDTRIVRVARELASHNISALCIDYGSYGKGVKVEYGEPVELGEYRGTFKTVGDHEHSEIIRLYVEEGLSVDRIAERLGRSSRTPHEHIKQHNRAVERSGFCPACRRVKSKFESEVAVRRARA